jgi:hypothetical protein
MTLSIFCLSLLLVSLVFGLSLLPLLLQSPITLSILTAGDNLHQGCGYGSAFFLISKYGSRSQCGSGSTSRSRVLMADI